tara:strand:+ start:3000 stop:3428 length:429 start_codon:yes stop_codon:yes gene_type:complete
MTDKEKFKIIVEYIKDLSIETPSATTLLFVRENIAKYNLDIDISSSALKNNLLEIVTKLTLQDKKNNKEKAFFEIKYASIISIDKSVIDKKEISKIVLCDLQNAVYPKIQNIFLDFIRKSGYPELNIEKTINFEKLYNDKFN